MRRAIALAFLVSVLTLPAAESQPVLNVAPDYVLGPDDQIRIWVFGMEEIGASPTRIDSGGHIDVPLAGRVRAAGLTLAALKTELTAKLSRELRKPEVAVTLTDFGSQPVSVVGSVNAPGVHQLKGRRVLAEVVALAGGLRPDAGCCIRVTRSIERGQIEGANARLTADGKYSVAVVKVRDFLEAKNPAENIVIQPHDVVSVPVAETVYAMGAVRKPGGFVLYDKEELSVMQVLALAEGMAPTPSPKQARILRANGPDGKRTEIAVDVSKIMSGQGEDLKMRANDILYIPVSNTKKVAIRAAEAAVYATTGLIIWRR